MQHSDYSVALIATCLVLASCEAPGSDELGESLRAEAAETLLPALHAYKESVGRYPGSLNELTLDMSWLPEGSTASYRLLDDGNFVFRFDYKPSWRSLGRPNCQYSSTTSDWKCYGYF